jgi:hypothetical protein
LILMVVGTVAFATAVTLEFAKRPRAGATPPPQPRQAPPAGPAPAPLPQQPPTPPPPTH